VAARKHAIIGDVEAGTIGCKKRVRTLNRQKAILETTYEKEGRRWNTRNQRQRGVLGVSTCDVEGALALALGVEEDMTRAEVDRASDSKEQPCLSCFAF